MRLIFLVPNDRTGQDRTRQNRTGQDRTEQDRTEQNKKDRQLQVSKMNKIKEIKCLK